MIRVRLNWTGPAAGFSILHFDGSVATPGLAQDAADAAALWWDDINALFASAQAMRVDPEVLEVNVTTGQTIGVTTVTSTALAGTGGAAQVPQASMVLVQWRTGNFVGGREIRGRTFVPGLILNALSAAGEVSSATLAIMNAASQTLADTPSPSFGVYSPTNSAFATVGSVSTWSELAVMRSRRE
jgi:hypothetical protein